MATAVLVVEVSREAVLGVQVPQVLGARVVVLLNGDVVKLVMSLAVLNVQGVEEQPMVVLIFVVLGVNVFEVACWFLSLLGGAFGLLLCHIPP